MMWEFLGLNLRVPVVSCPSHPLTIEFATRVISMFPSVKLLRGKFGQHRINLRDERAPQIPLPCSLWALAPINLFPVILIWTKSWRVLSQGEHQKETETFSLKERRRKRAG